MMCHQWKMFLREKGYKMGLITRGFGREMEYIPVAVHEFEMVSYEVGKKHMECYELKPKVQISVEKELKPRMSGEEKE